MSCYVLKCLVNLCDSLSPEDEALLVKPYSSKKLRQAIYGPLPNASVSVGLLDHKSPWAGPYNTVYGGYTATIDRSVTGCGFFSSHAAWARGYFRLRTSAQDGGYTTNINRTSSCSAHRTISSSGSFMSTDHFNASCECSS